MSKKTTRIYHGGPANSGSGGSGYSPPSDRLLDQLGAVLLQGITNVVHLKTGKTITADLDLEIDVVRDFFVYVAGDIFYSADTVEIDATDQNYIYGGVQVVLATDPNGTIEINLTAGNQRFMVNGIRRGATQAAAGAITDEIYYNTALDKLTIGL
jgi:hypothetical protein